MPGMVSCSAGSYLLEKSATLWALQGGIVSVRGRESGKNAREKFCHKYLSSREYVISTRMIRNFCRECAETFYLGQFCPIGHSLYRMLMERSITQAGVIRFLFTGYHSWLSFHRFRASRMVFAREAPPIRVECVAAGAGLNLMEKAQVQSV
jgi:hypothetical protein